ncbi:hypothetical protein CAPTEDRAFT_147765, partial [Capitella teleta]
MKFALGLKSKSGIHRLVNTLEERGFIRRIPQRARAIEVLRLPPSEGTTIKSAGFQPSIIDGDLGLSKPEQTDEQLEILSVPIMGRIAAGTPVEAIQSAEGNLSLPRDMLGKGEHFSLIVRGDSMIEAGIHDGDYAIIRKVNQANNGDIVVALIEGGEATLKRFRRHGKSIAL